MDLQRNVLQSWLDEDLVITGMEADCWEEALKILSGRLKEKGYVKDDFYRALVEREKSFPTGLPVEGDIKAAIPHANPDYVIKPAVAVGVLKKPVAFGEMGTSDRQIMCKLIFLLALNDSKNHLDLLRRLMDFFVDGRNLKEIACEPESKKIIRILVEKIS